MAGDGCVELTDPLYQSDLKLEPRFQSRLRLSDMINWTFAVITGRFGGVQKVVPANSSGHLKVADDAAATALGALATLLGGTAQVKIKSGSSTNLVNVDTYKSMSVGVWEGTDQALVLSAQNAGTTSKGLCVSNRFLKDIWFCLDDVWDQTNHYLRTHETT